MNNSPQSKVKHEQHGWQLKILGIDVFEWITISETKNFIINHDQLTGAYNRSGFIEKMKATLGSPEKPCALLHIDLDSFKLANELLGQNGGDEILIQVKERICSLLSGVEFIGRLGCDRFVVFCDVSSKEKASILARKIMKKLRDPYSTTNGSLSITVSVGVSSYPGDGTSHEKLLSKAESAVREAKTKGRNELVFWNDALHQQLHSLIELEIGLKQALLNNSFEIFFQPKYRLADGMIEGVEALLRWNHPEWGTVPPSYFISFAENHGLAKSIGEWVVRNTFAQIRSWKNQGLNVPPVAINLSPRHFADDQLLSWLHEMIAEYEISPHMIELEITEGVQLDSSEALLERLLELREEGFSIAVDDFGTGYSSLSYLANFPVNTIKIDKSFVSRILPGVEHEPIIESVIFLGHSLGMRIVAEGIENLAQLDFLREIGCEAGQGFYWSHPMPAQNFLNYLKTAQKDESC